MPPEDTTKHGLRHPYRSEERQAQSEAGTTARVRKQRPGRWTSSGGNLETVRNLGKSDFLSADSTPPTHTYQNRLMYYNAQFCPPYTRSKTHNMIVLLDIRVEEGLLIVKTPVTTIERVMSSSLAPVDVEYVEPNNVQLFSQSMIFLPTADTYIFNLCLKSYFHATSS